MGVDAAFAKPTPAEPGDQEAPPLRKDQVVYARHDIYARYDIYAPNDLTQGRRSIKAGQALKVRKSGGQVMPDAKVNVQVPLGERAASRNR
jgi:hypothetical protein